MALKIDLNSSLTGNSRLRRLNPDSEQESQSTKTALKKAVNNLHTDSAAAHRVQTSATTLQAASNDRALQTPTNKSARRLSREIADEIVSSDNSHRGKDNLVGTSSNKLDANRVQYLLED